jgi:hypothetical protein
METKHTPGPWIVRSLTGFPLQIATAPDDFGFGTPIADCSRHRLPGEAMSNARLIAAAPDLLVDLRNSTAALLDFQREAGGVGVHPKLDHLIMDNLATIAKATGEE